MASGMERGGVAMMMVVGSIAAAVALLVNHLSKKNQGQEEP